MSRFRASIAAAATAALLVIAAPGIATAAPPSESSSGAEPSATIEGPVEESDVVAMEQQIEKLNAEMLATADSAAMATGQAAVAKDQAKAAGIERMIAEEQAQMAQATATEVIRQMYMRGPVSLQQMTLLTADGPQEFMDRLALSDYITSYQSHHIDEMLAAEQALKDAEIAANAAAEAAQKAAEDAQVAAAQASEKLAEKQLELDAVKAAYYAQNPDKMPPPSADVPEYGVATGSTGTLTGQWALPAKGTFSSCFCGRWGTFHYGIDIAAPIGTPVWAAGSGFVLKAGPSSGFGLAVYIQHPNGDVTVYGHVNQYFVKTGQLVSAGQEIAEVGNRGYSTGPHLHFEVQKGAYGTRVDPQKWLADRNIYVG